MPPFFVGSQQEKYIGHTVYDAGPALDQHRINMLCLLGYSVEFVTLLSGIIPEGVDYPGVSYRIKPEELYIPSFEKGRGRRTRYFSKLRM